MTLRSDDIDAGAPAEERAALARVAARIERERPVPAVAFWGDLRGRLEGLRALRRHRFALTCVAAGAGMLAVATVGLAGVGPLAPGAVKWVISLSSGVSSMT